MDGNWREEILALLAKSSTFADPLRVCFIESNDAWHAFVTTIMKTLEYPMEATHIDKNGWDKIMKPMLGIILQRSKFARNFPRDVFYSTSTYQGLSVMHPWYRQQIVHIITLCKETVHGTPTGELLIANTEQLRLVHISTTGSCCSLHDSRMLERLTSFPSPIPHQTRGSPTETS